MFRRDNERDASANEESTLPPPQLRYYAGRISPAFSNQPAASAYWPVSRDGNLQGAASFQYTAAATGGPGGMQGLSAHQGTYQDQIMHSRRMQTGGMQMPGSRISMPDSGINVGCSCGGMGYPTMYQMQDAAAFSRHPPVAWPSVAMGSSPSSEFRNPTENRSSSRTFFIHANDYDYIEDLLRDSIDVLNSGVSLPTAPVWARISRLISERQPSQMAHNPLIQQQVDALFRHTMDSLNYMKSKNLSTTILSMAKIAHTVREAKKRRKMNNIQLMFSQLLLDEDASPMVDVFDFCAMTADRILPSFDARQTSNLAYAYALIGYDPKLGNQTLLGNIGDASVSSIQEFDGQGISNMVWACAKLKFRHTVLFQTIGDHIGQWGDLRWFNRLRWFQPLELSTILWAYASLNIKHATLFQKVGDHIHRLDDLVSFKPQELSNTVWAYATAGIQHPALFDKVGDHLVALDNLKSFKPRDFSSIVWAYAKAGVEHPALFKKLQDHPMSSNPSIHKHSIDALVEINGKSIGIEVDEPSHFHE